MKRFLHVKASVRHNLFIKGFLRLLKMHMGKYSLIIFYHAGKRFLLLILRRLHGGGMEIVMKNIFKDSAVIFGYKFIFTLLALAFFYSFAYLISFSNGLIIYSSVISLMYFASVYSYIWKIGKKDGKNGCFKIWRALACVLISEIPSAIITAVHFFNNSDISAVVYRIYQFIYIGFISSDASKIIVLIPVFIFAAAGYLLGYKNFEIYDRILTKIVYRKK